MAIAPVASNHLLSAQSNPGLTVSRSFAVNVTAGSLLFVRYVSFTNDPLTWADNLNGAWTDGPAVYNGSLGARLGCAYFPNSAAGAITVTGTGAQAAQNKCMVLSEYAGALTASPVDGTPVSNQSSGTSAISAGSITTTQAGIIIGAAIYTPTSPDPTPNANFGGSVVTLSGNYPMACEEWITSTGQAQSVDWSSKDFWSAIGIAFKAAGGGGGPVYVPRGLLLGVG